MDSEFQARSSADHANHVADCEAHLAGYSVMRIDGQPRLIMDTETGNVLAQVAMRGSRQGNRPGLRRVDTLKKVIADAWADQVLGKEHPYIVMTSHLPESGHGLDLLELALDTGLFDLVVNIWDVTHVQALKMYLAHIEQPI